jgi:hypothetical protein
MSHYDKEREASYASLLDSAFPPYTATTKCTRNMPIETDDPVASPETLRRWWDKAHDKGDEIVTWPTEERIDNIGRDAPETVQETEGQLLRDDNSINCNNLKVGCRYTIQELPSAKGVWSITEHYKTKQGTDNTPTTGDDMNKYQRKLTNPIIKEMDGGLTDIELEVFIDVYDVLDAFDVPNPATAHAVKKLLCTGSRGAKDWETDLQEAIDSLERAKSFPPMPF